MKEKTELQKYIMLASIFLPEGMHDWFEVVWMEDKPEFCPCFSHKTNFIKDNGTKCWYDISLFLLSLQNYATFFDNISEKEMDAHIQRCSTDPTV